MVPIGQYHGDAMTTEWMRFVLKCCSVAALVLLVIVALGPHDGNPARALVGRLSISLVILCSR